MPSRRLDRCVALALVAVSLSAAGADSAASDAFVLFDRTVRSYGELHSYRDRGELEIRQSSSPGSVDRYAFETTADEDGRFLFRLYQADDGGREVLIWTSAEGDRRWERGRGRARSVPSAANAVAMALWPLATDALLVPLLLANGVDLLPGVDAASLDGVEPCGGDTCDVLALSARGGTTTIRLWIARSNALIARLEAQASGGPGAGTTSVTLRHDIESIDADLAAERFSFTPPTTAIDTQVEDYVVSETIDVELRTLAVRALDSQGRPIRGLGPEDFDLRIDKAPVEVTSVDWLSSRGQRLEPLDAPSSRPPGPTLPRDESEGNVIVFFIQADFNAGRIKGQMRIMPFVRELLEALEPEDWVAVVSFDSHLKFWQDFSRDRQRSADLIERAIRFGAEPLVTPGPSMSLARSFPRAEAKDAASPERALRLTARALLDIPGEKIVLYLGWGLGRFGSSGFRLTQEYGRAIDTLHAAKASVFVLDVTDADYHTLELGIRQVARDTGGTYAKTNNFARREVLRLTETISGYYLLTIDAALLPEDLARLKLRLKDGKGTLLLRAGQISR